MKMLDRYLGAMMGKAVGDALGGTTEGAWYYEIERIYGDMTEIIGGGPLRLKAGEVTDDTYMAIAVAKGILKNPNDPYDEIGQEFIHWYCSDYINDCGATVGRAIRSFMDTHDWFEASKRAQELMGGKGDGNGSVMRCIPVALAYRSDPKKVAEVSHKQSMMTHNGELACNTCVLHNRIALDLLDGADLKESLHTHLSGTVYEDMLTTPTTFDTVPSNAYVYNTYRWVITILLEENNFEDVVIRSARTGGDSDTIGAIAGSLAGIHYGYEAIPDRFKKKILWRETIEDLAQKLYALSEGR
ncbi:ADP-ribosyl-[dinitrogen reductase] hydrolase [Melghirimyces profundicolus]|uniref:ADP-ribosyl-[dinitrogen reductase] hydrolase n=2 Tax=Melghirimyces profundicolus TaxID=1242148 RepID=A0A2T6B1C5_9BACL|nr:ADP-ribosyl-[dinitrogen reductase] hydrolase [Melghirimyces profundicolus]